MGESRLANNSEIPGTFSDRGNMNLCQIYGLLLFFIEFKQF